MSTSTLIKRDAARTLASKATHYPIVALTGPRQSGKSTLAKSLFPNKPYCSLEDLDNRHFAIEDPRRFLAQFPQGAILDEIQHAPDLFSYLQTQVDAEQKMGLYVLTGSQQFGLTAKISQSLAGRVGFVQLLPFTLNELKMGHWLASSLEQVLFTGFYPPIHNRNVPPQSWYSDYVMTYLERDVRQLINVQDLRTFHRFLQLCAARTGQILNLNNLATDCGISHNTAKAWISVLEASYILFLLPPHYRNYNKRLIKSPKIYFYDTGLAALLAGIQQPEQLVLHTMRGALFENMVVSELIKQRFNRGLLSNLYFWRDSQGHEVDILIEEGEQLIPIEVKASQTINNSFFDGLHYWRDLSTMNHLPAWLIYAGDAKQQRQGMHVLGWRDVDHVLSDDDTSIG